MGPSEPTDLEENDPDDRLRGQEETKEAQPAPRIRHRGRRVGRLSASAELRRSYDAGAPPHKTSRPRKPELHARVLAFPADVIKLRDTFGAQLYSVVVARVTSNLKDTKNFIYF